MKNKILYVQRVEGNNIHCQASRIAFDGDRQHLSYEITVNCNHVIKKRMWRYLLKSSKKRTLKLFKLQYNNPKQKRKFITIKRRLR